MHFATKCLILQHCERSEQSLLQKSWIQMIRKQLRMIFNLLLVVSDWTTQILFDFLAKIDWVKFGSLESFGKLPEIENSEVKSLMLIVREIL